MSSFEELALDPAILKALARMQYTTPTPIQVEAIPLIQKGGDLIAQAQTGSGKTAACAIPICNRVDVGRKEVQTLIIVPTRELALQYATEVQKIGLEKGVKAFAILGGESVGTQEAKLRAGVQVVVATPGRLIDLIYSRLIDLSHVTTLVLDEADEMLSMGFYEDLEFIIKCLVHDHQTLLFSATMPEGIRRIAHGHMKDPQEVVLTRGDEATPHRLEHRFLYCGQQERDSRLVELLRNERPEQCLLFAPSRHQCESIYRLLQRHFDRVDFLHAGLGQEIRSSITHKFRQGKTRYLVATDVASRGLDFSHVTHVIMYQLAPDPEVYIHRSGRAGRCERAGVAIALITDREMHTFHKVMTLLRKEPVWVGAPPPPRTGGGGGHHRPPGRRPPQRTKRDAKDTKDPKRAQLP